MNNIIIIDCEASGLTNDSYPIEIGIANSKENYSFLIKPHHTWSHWDLAAENLHKIKRSELSSGLDIYEAVNLLNKRYKGKTLLSDCSDYDTFWVDKLFNSVGVKKLFIIDSIYKLNINKEIYKKEKDYSITNLNSSDQLHRAKVDSQIIYSSLLKSIQLNS